MSKSDQIISLALFFEGSIDQAVIAEIHCRTRDGHEMKKSGSHIKGREALRALLSALVQAKAHGREFTLQGPRPSLAVQLVDLFDTSNSNHKWLPELFGTRDCGGTVLHNHIIWEKKETISFTFDTQLIFATWIFLNNTLQTDAEDLKALANAIKDKLHDSAAAPNLMSLTEIDFGTFGYCFRTSDTHGAGISSSSVFAVLYQAAMEFLKNGTPLNVEAVAKAALNFERRQAMGASVAADDVYPITFGGLVKVKTWPNKILNGQIVFGKIEVEQLKHDPTWMAEHVLVAIKRNGLRHDVPNLLQSLLRHPDAKKYVRKFTELSHGGAAAIEAMDIQKLAGLSQTYRDELDVWSGGKYTIGVKSFASELKKRFAKEILAWRPPGGGASASIILFLNDLRASVAVSQYLNKQGWHVMPACVTPGICGEFLKERGADIRITAGHRIDFFGGADLGSDILIGEPGCCLSMAIEPRSEIRLLPRKEWCPPEKNLS